MTQNKQTNKKSYGYKKNSENRGSQNKSTGRSVHFRTNKKKAQDLHVVGLRDLSQQQNKNQDFNIDFWEDKKSSSQNQPVKSSEKSNFNNKKINPKSKSDKKQAIYTGKYKNNKQPESQTNKQTEKKVEPAPKDRLRIIPLGGCEEVGRNMTVFEYGNDIIIVDIGMQFPEEDMPGIDYIIPNTDYLKGKEKNIRAVVFSHGHLDHIGAAPIILEKIGNPMIIGSKLTIHMIKARQEDYKKGSSKNTKVRLINQFNERVKLGNFNIGFFPVAHSIMDAMGVILETPSGTVIHPGDWKLGQDQEKDLEIYRKLSKLKKPTILMLESLGVHYNKQPIPEEEMYKNIEKIISGAQGRVIIGTFSSNVDRIKVVLEMSEKYGKKVAVDGFSMKSNIQIAKELGYVKFNLKNLIDIQEISKLDDKKVIIMCTGAQGEENAVLARIANGEHRFIKFKKSDTVIFSSSVIPGNERTVQRLKDLIYRQSDNVIHSEIMDVHSGGHATAEDVKKVITAVSPTYFIPVYANHYMLKEAAKLAKGLGYTDKNIFVPDNGSIIEFGKNISRVLDKKVNADPIFVDGLGVSDLQHVVLRDRQILSEEGMLVVIATINSKTNKLIHNPDIISRGLVYLKENQELLSGIRKKVRKIVESGEPKKPIQDDYLKNKIRNDVGQFVFSKTGKRPMVLPVVIEV